MREAGVNLVSVGIFSWARLQPNERIYTFTRLDRVMDLLAENGVFAYLATATASPLAWLSKNIRTCGPSMPRGKVLPRSAAALLAVLSGVSASGGGVGVRSWRSAIGSIRRWRRGISTTKTRVT